MISVIVTSSTITTSSHSNHQNNSFNCGSNSNHYYFLPDGGFGPRGSSEELEGQATGALGSICLHMHLHSLKELRYRVVILMCVYIYTHIHAYYLTHSYKYWYIYMLHPQNLPRSLFLYFLDWLGPTRLHSTPNNSLVLRSIPCLRRHNTVRTKTIPRSIV